MQKEMRTPKKKSKCIVCGFELSKPLFVLPNMPAGAQAMPDKAGLESDRGIELPLCRCPECGLYQFDCEPVDYYKDAIRVVGLSETMRNLRRSDYRHLMEDYGLKGAKFIECGCGNGDFLEVLKEFPADIYGMEAPALSDAKYDDSAMRVGKRRNRIGRRLGEPTLGALQLVLCEVCSRQAHAFDCGGQVLIVNDWHVSPFGKVL